VELRARPRPGGRRRRQARRWCRPTPPGPTRSCRRGPDGIPAGARLADFRLLIYKRGFVAYRSDRRFADFGQRHDFAQRDNFVELERWRPDHSHARHLRFVGGGGVIAAVTGWETDEAIAELTAPAAPARR
jgi:hypothetical protein